MTNKNKTLAQRMMDLEKMVENLQDEDGYGEIMDRLRRIEQELGIIHHEPDPPEDEDEDEDEEAEQTVGPYPFDDHTDELDGTCYIICMPNPPKLKGLPSYLGYDVGCDPEVYWANNKSEAHVFSTKARAQEAVRQLKELQIQCYQDGKKIKQQKPFIPPSRTVRINQIEV